MAKASKINAVVAEMLAEKHIVDACIIDLGNEGRMADAVAVLSQKSGMLGFAITRLSGTNSVNELPAPKPARTRKGRKATEPSI